MFPYLFLILCSAIANVLSSSATSGRQNDLEKIPLLLLISMDGFRYNYLDNLTASTANFHYFLKNGVHPKWVRNVFPSVTFTNHMSILTGLYPDSHGIVNNNFYDPVLNATFDMSVMANNFESQWFDVGAEPIWVTNHKKGGRRFSGSIMWPATLAPVKCVKVDRFIPNAFWGNETIDFKYRIDKIISWYTDDKQPINLGFLYFPEPDEVGHHYGTDSPKLTQMIQTLDEALGYLRLKLEEHDLLNRMNIIITSDHGMTMWENKTINLDEKLDPSLYSLWPGDFMSFQLQPKPGVEDEVFNKLDGQSNFYAYRKGSSRLEALHYSDSNRIPQIVLEPKKGWIFVNNATIKRYSTFPIKGLHGYDPKKVPEMFPFFIASGPAFKKGVTVNPFDMVDIYPLMCHILGLTPAPNNGSLEHVKNLLIISPENGGNIQTTTITFLVIIILAALVAGLFSMGVIRHSRSSHLRRGINQMEGLPFNAEGKQQSALLNDSDEDEL